MSFSNSKPKVMAWLDMANGKVNGETKKWEVRLRNKSERSLTVLEREKKCKLDFKVVDP